MTPINRTGKKIQCDLIGYCYRLLLKTFLPRPQSIMLADSVGDAIDLRLTTAEFFPISNCRTTMREAATLTVVAVDSAAAVAAREDIRRDLLLLMPTDTSSSPITSTR